MRTGPGTSGRSCFARVSVSKSRIEPSHRFVAVERRDSRGEPRTARRETVGPKKYMRTGPGTSGRSCFARVSVSKSRIEPSHRFVAVERSDHGGELRTAVATRQRNTKRVEIAADSLQLAHERLRRV